MAQRSQVCENGPELILVHSEVGRAALVIDQCPSVAVSDIDNTGPISAKKNLE